MADNPLLEKIRSFLEGWDLAELDYALCVAIGLYEPKTFAERKLLFRAFIALMVDDRIPVVEYASSTFLRLLPEMLAQHDLSEIVELARDEIDLALVSEFRPKVRKCLIEIHSNLGGRHELLRFAA